MSFALALFAVSRSYFIILFSACQELFLKVFSRFFQIFYLTFQFLAALACRCLAATFSIILSFLSLSRTFFNFFSSLFHFIFMLLTFPLLSPPSCDDLYYYTLSSSFVNTFFEKILFFFKNFEKARKIGLFTVLILYFSSFLSFSIFLNVIFATASSAVPE